MSKQHWSDYWSTGALTSLPADFKINYDGELAEYWFSVIEGLAPNSRILDVCTGNGAVAIMLAEMLKRIGKEVSITAVDASEINQQMMVQSFPDKKQVVDSIDFISNCYIEDLKQCVEQKFDLIVSQYGIEYCDEEMVAKQITDALNSGGRLVFVSHSPHTAMLEFMEAEEIIYQYIENEGVLEYLQKFIDNKMTVNGFKNKLVNTLQSFSQHTLKSHPLLNSWGENLFQLYQMDNQQLKLKKPQIKSYLNLNINARARANDMLNVCYKLKNNPDWYKTFTTSGLQLINDGEIHYKSKHNVGHYYEFIKRD
ncbi:class I SAM-dependent methyltransferase [Marinicella sp. S1101]|uniref:class I SAM-dependent methyltransferase n=1 Tax=Marinicella marina TaxID=2996016 RepID=UPI002260BDFB|nr:class I SAM-dependent methyltransferase [Marinicella marina]MCX7552930.1 class I SAM-dependent methyltransferase [Marinicella marina]MDJ1139761.1 class I SAM-dependent methyltransferase [Marinicella marina]